MAKANLHEEICEINDIILIIKLTGFFDVIFELRNNAGNYKVSPETKIKGLLLPPSFAQKQCWVGLSVCRVSL